MSLRSRLIRRRGLLLEHVVDARLDVAAAQLEAGIERQHRRFLALTEDRFLEQLQQQVVETGQRLDAAVIQLHEVLDRLVVVGVHITEQRRQLDLMIEQQPVLVAAGDHVQGEAHPPQEILAGEQLVAFLLAEEAAVAQLVQGEGVEVALGDPGHGVDVAQAAGAFLDVGLQLVAGIVVLGVALALLFQLGAEEGVHRPHLVRRHRFLQRGVQRGVAAQRARLDQVGDDGDVLRRQFGAFGHRAHAAADFQADVPEEGEELLQRRLVALQGVLVVQHQQVDVGMGQQLAAAVAAHRDQAQSGRLLRQELQPGLVQHLVHQVGAGMHQRIGSGALVEHAGQPLAAPVQGGAEGGDRLLAVGAQARPHLAGGKNRGGLVFRQIQLGAHQCGTFSSARRVRIS